jgi:hypothetical protein
VKKLKKLNYKTKYSTISLILLLTISATLVAMPSAIAQESRKTYPFLGAVPNPVGVGQMVLFHVGIFQQLGMVDQYWDGLSITIERPDGETDTIDNIRTDATGGTGAVYTPTMSGTHYCQSHFPEQELKWTYSRGTEVYTAGTIMLASDSEVLELVVQEDQISYYPGQPLPSEYWTRPIDAQLREWSVVSGSWLWTDNRLPRAVTGNDEAPETAHILWTKPLTWGGQAGGTMGDWSFSHGDAYEGKWDNRIIINGILIYPHRVSDLPRYYTAVNLRTGEELWKKTLSSPEEDNLGILFGQNLKWAGYNHHAIYDYIWATSGFGGFRPIPGDDWYAFDPYTGEWQFTVKNVPPGTTVFDESNGWLYRVNLDWTTGEGYIWSMTDLIEPFDVDSTIRGSWSPEGNIYKSRYPTYDAAAVDEAGASDQLTYLGETAGANAQRAYIANFTFPNDLPGGGGAVRAIAFGDRAQYTDVWSGKIFGLQYSYTEVNTWAISLESGQEGTLLFSKTWNAPSAWETGTPVIEYETTSLEDGVSVIWAKWELIHYGFSTENGEFLWNTDEPEYYMNMYGSGSERPYLIWNGKFYTGGVGGHVYCYDLTDGHVIWTYLAEDPYQEYLFANQWWEYIVFIADGKLYMNHQEHSAIEPMPRGGPWIVLDATTGDEIARADGLFRGHHWGGIAIIGDSIIAHYDTYDLRIYAIGKGPSEITVSAAPEVVTKDTSVNIKGTMMDVSPGTEDVELRLRFPNGVPAIADEGMSEWMLYVYKQFERPDATGVTVKLEAVDPNMGYHNLGTTCSDAYGNYGFSFKPDVEGTWMIIATFEGSKSYYGSTETTYLTVGPAPSPEQPIEPEEPEPEAPLITTEIAIILAVVAVAIIAVVGYWILKKRK